MINAKNMKKKAALTIVTAAVTAAMMGMSVFAATGTVKSSDVNVRSNASTSGSIVGKVTTGETYDLGEGEQDSSGMTWYPITLSDGTQGYVRSDFVDVTEDEAVDAGAGVDVTDAGETATENTDTSSTDTGDYQIVLAPDENGENTYYLYNNAEGQRMKLSDIEKLQSETKAAQDEAASVKNRYRVILVVLAVLLAAAVIALVLLFLRLRDAMTNGRRERDLYQERKDARRNNANADGLNTLRNGQRRSSNPSDRRNQAYASGARRVSGSDRNSAPTRTYRGDDARPVREADASRRPAQAGARRPITQDGAPVRRPAQDGQTQVRRPVAPEQGEQATRRVAAAPGQAPVRRPAADNANARSAAPQQNAEGARANTAPRKPQPRRIADEDDDFDYDYISLDDEK